MERKQTTMQRYGKRTVIKLVKKKKKKNATEQDKEEGQENPCASEFHIM
jgi:hypothetical protein